MGSLKIQNAMASAWSPLSGTFVLSKPTGNVAIICTPDILQYSVTVNSLLNGTKSNISGCTSIRIYYNNINSRDTSKYIDKTLTNGSVTFSLDYGTYYWIFAKEYNGGTLVAGPNGQVQTSAITANINYYTVTASAGSNVVSATVSHSPVMSGTNVSFTATKGSSTGYVYSDTISWTSALGNLGSFTSTSGVGITKNITAETRVNAVTTKTVNTHSIKLRFYNLNLTRNGNPCMDGEVISNVAYNTPMTFNYSFEDEYQYQFGGCEYWYGTNSHVECTNTGSAVTFNMPDTDIVLMIGGESLLPEGNFQDVSYNTTTATAYDANRFFVTDATNMMGDIAYRIVSTGTKWVVAASDNEEDSTGDSDVFLKENNYISTFRLEYVTIRMTTYYTLNIVKGTGISSYNVSPNLPSGNTKIRRKGANSQSTCNITASLSTGYTSLVMTATNCTKSAITSGISISNVTGNVTVNISASLIKYDVTYGSHPAGTTLTASDGATSKQVEYGKAVACRFNLKSTEGTATVYIQGEHELFSWGYEDPYIVNSAEYSGWARLDDGETYAETKRIMSKSSAIGSHSFGIYSANDGHLIETKNFIFVPSVCEPHYTGTGTLPSTVTPGISFSLTNVRSSGTLTVTPSSCMREGTLIALADGTHKPIEEIESGAQLLSYNPYTNTPCTTTVIFSQPVDETNSFYKCITNDNATLYLSGRHGFWNAEKVHPIDYKTIDTNGLKTLDENNKEIVVYPAEFIELDHTEKSYSLICSLGLFYANGILSCHRANQKKGYLGHLTANLSDEVEEVFNQDYADYLKATHVKNTEEYFNEHQLYVRARNKYNKIICDCFNRLGFDIKNHLTKDTNNHPLYLVGFAKYYPEYAGKDAELDNAYETRLEIEDSWTNKLSELMGVESYKKYKSELFKRCFERDLTIEHLVKEEDFEFTE